MEWIQISVRTYVRVSKKEGFRYLVRQRVRERWVLVRSSFVFQYILIIPMIVIPVQ